METGKKQKFEKGDAVELLTTIKAPLNEGERYVLILLGSVGQVLVVEDGACLVSFDKNGKNHNVWVHEIILSHTNAIPNNKTIERPARDPKDLEEENEQLRVENNKLKEYVMKLVGML